MTKANEFIFDFLICSCPECITVEKEMNLSFCYVGEINPLKAKILKSQKNIGGIIVTTTKYNSSDYLKTPKDVAAYIEAVLEEDDPKLLLAALRDVTESQGGMAMMAKKTGLGRESLYKSLSENGNPKLSTLFDVIKALGLHLSVKAA